MWRLVSATRLRWTQRRFSAAASCQAIETCHKIILMPLVEFNSWPINLQESICDFSSHWFQHFLRTPMLCASLRMCGYLGWTAARESAGHYGGRRQHPWNASNQRQGHHRGGHAAGYQEIDACVRFKWLKSGGRDPTPLVKCQGFVLSCNSTLDTRFFSCLAACTWWASEEGRQLQCSEKLALPASSPLVWTLWWIWPLCSGRGQHWNTRLCGEFGHFFVGLWLGQRLGTFQTHPTPSPLIRLWIETLA